MGGAGFRPFTAVDRTHSTGHPFAHASPRSSCAWPLARLLLDLCTRQRLASAFIENIENDACHNSSLMIPIMVERKLPIVFENPPPMCPPSY